MLRITLLSLLFLTAGTALAQNANPFSGYRVVDMSYPFNGDTIYWPTADGFQLEPGFVGITDKGYYYSSNTLTTAEHGGTHIDAPIHFAENQLAVDEIPLEQLIGAAVVIDVSAQADKNPDYQVSVADIQAWEASHGRLPTGIILLLHTGYGQYWPDRLKYLGTDKQGAEAVPLLHFPGLHPETARWLVKERDINAFGLDTPSVDYGQSVLFESHQILFKQNIPAFENVANLGQLPAVGAHIIALPIKTEGGSGGPLRMIGLVPE